MKDIFRALLAASLIVLASAAGEAAADTPLLPEHKDWLEMVRPIISKTERDVFLNLTTAEERNTFIRYFWKQHDTLPDTSENEFQKEYMKRVQFADQNFGHDSGKKGSLTERGFFYLLLGPPLERNLYTTESQILPLELWFYKGDERYGLPPYFYLIFYQPMGMGEFRLYSPGVEGPETLVIPSMTEQTVTRSSAFEIIHKLNAELASASLSYMPGERPMGAGSFSSDQIIASVRELPEKEFSDAYARNYLDYKDFVETEYSDAFTESTLLVKVFRAGGADFIHWTLEPGRVNFALRDEAYVAFFELVLRLVDAAGRTVFERNEEIPLKISAEQYKQHERRRFAFQDILPVIPGDYRFLLFLENKTGRDFSSQEARISVPVEPGPLALGPILLFRDKESVPFSAGPISRTAFELEGSRFLFDSSNEFPKNDALGLFVQPLNLSGDAAETARLGVRVEIRPADSAAPVWSATRPLNEVRPAGHTGIEWEGIPLSPLEAGYYEIEVALLDSSAKPMISARDHFILLNQAGALLPWIYSRKRPAFPNAEQLAILGAQYFAVEDYVRARDMLEKSLAFKDASPTRLLLAKTLYGQKAYQDSLALITPIYESTRDREAAKIMALDFAGLEDWNSALVYLKDVLKQATEIGVLNLTAECLIRLNRAEEALPLLQKSLELNPGQEEAKRLLDQAKKRRPVP